MIKCKLNEIHKNVIEGINEIQLTDYQVKIKFKVVRK